MSAVVISTSPPKKTLPGRGDDGIAMRFDNWPTAEVVAATLIQSPPYACHRAGRWDEDAELITALRNAAPALLALARRGLRE